MGIFLAKVLVTALLVAAVSGLARRSTFLAALLAAVPLVSMLAMTWLYVETRDPLRVAALGESIFWLVLPSLAFFLVFPLLLRRGLGFGLSAGIALALTLVCFGLLILILNRSGIRL
jgi:hypothetical protein